MFKKFKKICVYIILFLLTSFLGNEIIHWIKNKKARRQGKRKYKEWIKKNMKKIKNNKIKIKESNDKIKEIKNKYSKIVGGIK